jgi:aspartyl-tRNA(Asn)/glutamyl-tRNA(Gln) amidotransferase subunit A
VSGAATSNVSEALARIAAHDTDLGAFLAVDREGALAAARHLDAQGDHGGPLTGVPLAVKDALCTRGLRTTAGSRLLAHYVPPYDATAVARLRRAGAVIVGKTNLDEFSMGSSTEHSAFFPTRNPWDPTRAPGGSSGGSAVAVAARMAPAALGSDTGGSIRQPASFTGVVGIKPTYGRVSRYGLVAFASSLDQVGVLAADVATADTVLRVIAGVDPHDSTTRDAPPIPPLAKESDVYGLRIGVPTEYFAEGLDPEVEARVREALGALEARGAKCIPVSLPHTRYAVSTYYIVASAEASSNLSRFDGVRYGTRVAGESLHEMYERTRSQGFGAEVKRRILLGTFVLSAGYYDAYYKKAMDMRQRISREFAEVFRAVDVLCTPTTPTPAFRLGEKSDPLSMYLADIYTLPASLAGLPALSVPCGFVGNLPVGLQVIGRAWEEATVLRVAAATEADFAPRGALP